MNEPPLPEPLDDFLNHPPNLPADAEAREAILRMTANRLHKTGWVHLPIWLGVAATIVIVVLSIIFARLSFSRAPAPPPEMVKQNKEALDIPVPKAVAVEAAVNPRDLEWRAFDAEDDSDRVRLYFQAGDLYLDRFDDIQSALRCYQQAIYHGDSNDLEVNSTDNWLVMALKRDHRKEK
jgi:hypothetical protein